MATDLSSTLSIVAVLATGFLIAGCDGSSSRVPDGKTVKMNAATPDRYCLDNPSPFSKEMTNEDLQAHFKHFLLCDTNPDRADSYLDELVSRGDADALTTKGILTLEADRPRAVTLLERAASMGNERARRTLNTLPPVRQRGAPGEIVEPQ